MSYDKSTIRLLGQHLPKAIETAKKVHLRKQNRVFYTLYIPFARGPFVLNFYTMGTMTTGVNHCTISVSLKLRRLC